MTSVKVIMNKQTRQPKGYGYIEFYTRAIAERVLEIYNGTIMPNGGQIRHNGSVIYF
jgi:RNA recognition motif-containing protein